MNKNFYNSSRESARENSEKEPIFTITTLLYIFNPQGEMLLLAKKKTESNFTIALDKWNAPGGKANEGETLEKCILREGEEEAGIVADESQLEYKGKNRFIFPTKPEWNQECHIYIIRNYTREVHETEEMKLPQRFDPKELPYDNMRESDRIRLPAMLANSTLEYTFRHSDTGKVLSYEKKGD